jgi:hypothetical protein
MRLKDNISSRLMLAATVFACLLFFLMLIGLYIRASPILSIYLKMLNLNIGTFGHYEPKLTL